MKRIIQVEIPKLLTGTTSTALPLAADKPNPSQEAQVNP